VISSSGNEAILTFANGRHCGNPEYIFARRSRPESPILGRRFGEDVGGLEVLVQVAVEAAGGFGAFNTADGEIHQYGVPGNGLISCPKLLMSPFGRTYFHKFCRQNCIPFGTIDPTVVLAWIPTEGSRPNEIGSARRYWRGPDVSFCT